MPPPFHFFHLPAGSILRISWIPFPNFFCAGVSARGPARAGGRAGTERGVGEPASGTQRAGGAAAGLESRDALADDPTTPPALTPPQSQQQVRAAYASATAPARSRPLCAAQKHAPRAEVKTVLRRPEIHTGTEAGPSSGSGCRGCRNERPNERRPGTGTVGYAAAVCLRRS